MLKKLLFVLLGFSLFTVATKAESIKTWGYGKLATEVWLDELDTPWSLVFTSKTDALLTELNGNLWQIQSGKRKQEAVRNTPAVHVNGQGGLLAVAIDPDYANNSWVYLAYSQPLKQGLRTKSMTVIARGKIEDNVWSNNQILFEAKAEHYTSAGRHYGSRIVFDKQGYLYFSVGDRGKREQAQSLQTPNGKIHRIHKDGRIPKDNPFLNSPYPSIFTYGNRNPQGLAMHPVTGQLWSAEHGPRGGDELNILISGTNYGWPEISYGINYIGTELTPYVRKPGMQQPAYYWRPSTAVSNIAFYTGKPFHKWQNKLLVSALKYQQVSLLDIEEGRVMHEEVILRNAGRVRDVAVGVDGYIYVVLNGPGRVLKLAP